MKTLYKPKYIAMLAFLLAYISNIGSPHLFAGEIIHEFNFDISKLRIDSITDFEGVKYVDIKWDGMYQQAEVGEPNLPIYSASFVVPSLSNKFTVTVDDVKEGRCYALNHLVYPAQEANIVAPEGLLQFTPPNGKGYTSSNSHEFAQYIGHRFLDGDIHIVTIVIRPCYYDVIASKLIVYDKINVKLSYNDCSKEEAGLIPNAVMINKKNINLQKWVVNPLDYSPTLTNHNVMRSPSLPQTKGDYCIITPNAFVNSFRKLALWKKQKGYKVTIKSIESILSDPIFKITGHAELEDSAASIRAFIKSVYDSSDNGNVYCLLAGHESLGMPIRRVKSTQMTNYHNRRGDIEYTYNKLGECYIPTDAYFSDILTSWNLKKEPESGIYTIMDKEISPSLLVNIGRIMCKTEKEINDYINKIIIYESNPGFGDNDYLDKSLMFVQYDLISNGKYKTFASILNQFSSVNTMIDQYYGNTDKLARGPKGSHVIDAMSNVGFSSWMGHGNPASVMVTGPGSGATDLNYAITALDSYTKSDSFITQQEIGNGLDNLNNNNKPGVAYSISCDITPFDNLTGSDGYSYNIKYNMGESFILGGNYGGVALFGNTRVGYTYASPELQNCFGKALLENWNAGMVENESKNIFMLSNHSNDSYHVSYANNLIGEPEFEIWKGSPSKQAVDVVYGNGKIRVSGSSLPGSCISVYDGVDLKILKSNISSTSIDMSFVPNTLDMALCSIWHSGQLPIIRLYGKSGILPLKRDFIARDAEIGLTDSFIIANGGQLNVDAVDLINLGNGFCIQKGGSGNFSSMREVIAAGVSVEDGGSLIIKGECVVLEEGFSLQKGGCLTVN